MQIKWPYMELIIDDNNSRIIKNLIIHEVIM